MNNVAQLVVTVESLILDSSSLAFQVEYAERDIEAICADM